MKDIRHRLQRYFIAGILVIVPIAISVWVLLGLLNWMDGFLGRIPDTFLPVHIPGLGIILLILLILSAGALTTNLLGKRILHAWERILSRIPLIRAIYSGTKQVLEALVKNKGDQFRRVVLFEYPRKGLWSIGFVTGTLIDKGPANPVGKRLVAVLYPTTPNPTTGFFMLVPEEELIPLDVSVEEAFKMVISAGMITPERFSSQSKLPLP
ncbi:MAG: DUF502 domain-containing protein [Deltaproteobacteria bacterium]|nr:DUF502 domain-containing protein [Deltaproteobacteria bacterium]